MSVQATAGRLELTETLRSRVKDGWHVVESPNISEDDLKEALFNTYPSIRYVIQRYQSTDHPS